MAQLTTKVLDPNIQLLIRCLISGQEVEHKALSHLDLNTFLYTLECHRLTILFYETTKDKLRLSEPFKTSLTDLFTLKKMQILKHVAELCRVNERFEKANIASVALKGPIVGLQYYETYSMRECNDLDILVKPQDVQTAFGILLEMGYELTEVLWNSPKQKNIYHKTFHHYNLYNDSNDIMIELHWRLYSSTDIDVGANETLWNNLKIHRLGRFEIRALAELDNFIHLCVHGSSHQWKRLFWVQDIVRIIQKEDDSFLESAYLAAARRGLDRYILEGCNLSNILFKVPLPAAISEAICRDKRISELSSISLFAMNNVMHSEQSPVANWHNFTLASIRLYNHYKTTYFLGGRNALLNSIKRFFINPKYWSIYSFNDKLFALNYFAAPFFWAYSVLNKNKE